MAEPFGPFCPDLDATERTAQLRCLQALVRAYHGEAQVIVLMRHAESDHHALAPALQLFDRLPALTRRRVLGTYAKLHDPRFINEPLDICI